jgi:hypothetical protein
MNEQFLKIQADLEKSIQLLFENDGELIQNDVSERAITHKLAEHLQTRFTDLKVDCEYNRNAASGLKKPKKLSVLTAEYRTIYPKLVEEEEIKNLSTFPDIIVHKRLTNEENLLVIEVKKVRDNGQSDSNFDKLKLKLFTEATENNSYHFRYGAFILLTMSQETPTHEVTWYSEGNEI